MHQTIPTIDDTDPRSSRGVLLGDASACEREREAKGPPFWEDWRGAVADEDIEFVRVIFEEFCASWE